MRYSRAIAVAGLVVGLVGLAPIAVPGVAQTVAQPTDQQKAEGDRLLQQGIQQLQSNRNQASEQSFKQALMIYHQIQHQPGVGAALIGLGEANLRLRNRTKALELSQQAIAIAKG